MCSSHKERLQISLILVTDSVQKMKGAWDSIHVMEVHDRAAGRMGKYKLTSTVMLYMLTNKEESGDMNLSGSLTRQVNVFHHIFRWNRICLLMILATYLISAAL